MLNLFAYTGGASVALAAAGARVTHVDASRPAIGWARENAALNGVSTIRWIHEDARRFVDRERRRGRQYDALLLDPPAFGRGPAGDWQLDRDLAGLLEAAIALLRPDPAFVLLNVYTGDLDAGDLDRLLAWALDARPDAGGLGPIEADTLSLTSADGRELPNRIYARARRRPQSPSLAAESTRRAAGRVSWGSTKPPACLRRHHVAALPCRAPARTSREASRLRARRD